MSTSKSITEGSRAARGEHHLSYKFQRLREAIRQSIESGEYRDRLPGERTLGRLYDANAKTVNKALSDLCSEGLLVRHIGRGTFVARNGGTLPGGISPKVYRFLSRATKRGSCRDVLREAVHRRVTETGHILEQISAIANGPEPRPFAAGWVAKRRDLAGLICYPNDPLSDGAGGLSDRCLAEAHRRQVPVVLLGACSRSAKTHAVVPDYGDAGFRLAEYAFQLGCEALMVVHSAAGRREIDAVVIGCQASSLRRSACLTRVVLNGGAHWAASDDLLDMRDRLCRSGEAGVRTGVVCIGSSAMRRVVGDTVVAGARQSGRVVLGGVVEPGDPTARALGVTSYEVDIQRIADWVVRLLVEARAGVRPAEVLVSGRLRARASSADADVGGRGADTEIVIDPPRVADVVV
ncbi:MAG: GntR family transcriptional regulator [Phycisphaerae bacterium]